MSITVHATAPGGATTSRRFADTIITPKDAEPARRSAREQADAYITARREAGCRIEVTHDA